MRKLLFYVMALPTIFGLFMACSDDGDEKDDNVTVTMTGADLTKDGYFDGILYYQVFSNSPSQVVVVKARKNALNVVIPSTVKINEVGYTVVSIASGAFKECVNLLSVTIPKGVVSIGSSVFKDCYDLETVRCKMPNPCEISNDVFTGQTYNSAKLYVPKGSKRFYELTYNWNYFSNIVEE